MLRFRLRRACMITQLLYTGFGGQTGFFASGGETKSNQMAYQNIERLRYDNGLFLPEKCAIGRNRRGPIRQKPGGSGDLKKSLGWPCRAPLLFGVSVFFRCYYGVLGAPFFFHKDKEISTPGVFMAYLSPEVLCCHFSCSQACSGSGTRQGHSSDICRYYPAA